MHIDPDRAALFARIGGRKPDFRNRQRSLQPLSLVGQAVLTRLGGQDTAQLAQLWRNWDIVMGPDVSPLAHPLGTHKKVLLVGGEDNMCLQELTYLVPEILERANAFMDKPYFERVKLHLLPNSAPAISRLTAEAVPDGKHTHALPVRPAHLGRLSAIVGQLDPENPVTASYLAYLQAFRDS